MNQAAKEAKIIPLQDEDGNKLPKNMSKQFRDVQTGIEYLKDAADNISTELKGVNHKLGANTTDLGLITKKVNSIDSNLKNHMKQTKKAFESTEKTTQAILDLIKQILNLPSSK